MRRYQSELAALVLQPGNHLVVLPTGAGKTLVGLELLYVALAKHPTRRTFFLAPTVALVEQHAAVFNVEASDRGLALRASVIAGGKRDDTSRVLFATPAAALLFLGRGSTCMKELSLLVFDEAHHGVGTNKGMCSQQPYAEIARLYASHEGTARPKLLGLTASPGQDRHQIKMLLDRFEFELLIIGRNSTSHDELRRTVPSPTLHTSEVPSSQVFRNFLADAKNLQCRHGIEAERLKSIQQLAASVRSIGWHRQQSVDPELEEAWEALLRSTQSQSSSPFFDRTVELLLKHSRDEPTLRAIIFVETRSVASEMVKALADDVRLSGLVRPTKLVGHNESVTLGRFTPRMQRTALKEFRDGSKNVLVATSVAEEGIDIASCSLVIRVVPPATVVQFIQSGGRARHPDSAYHILCVDDVELGATESTAQQATDGEMLAAVQCRASPARNSWDVDGLSNLDLCLTNGGRTVTSTPTAAAASTEVPSAERTTAGQTSLDDSNEELGTLVRRVLEESDKPLDKLQIRREIPKSRRPTASDVNRVLYAMGKAGTVTRRNPAASSSKPLWKLSVGTAPSSEEPTTTAAAISAAPAPAPAPAQAPTPAPAPSPAPAPAPALVSTSSAPTPLATPSERMSLNSSKEDTATLVRRVLEGSDEPLDKLQIRRAISELRRPTASKVNKVLYAMEKAGTVTRRNPAASSSKPLWQLN